MTTDKEKDMSFELRGTAGIQGESLRLFMGALGYYPARPNGGWATSNQALAPNRVISTRNAIRLHNLKREEWVEIMPGWFGVPFMNLGITINNYAMNVIQAAKLVEHVKLVPVRKAPNGMMLAIDPNANLIRAADPSYMAIFGLPQ